MLAIRMQRIGRSGHAQFRVVVQDSRRSPKRGKVVAQLGSYDPHAKTTTLNKEKAQTFLNNGAQPSERVVNLFKKEGLKLPKWVEKPVKKQGKIRNPEKLRKNRPVDAVAAETKAETEPVARAEASTEETQAEASSQPDSAATEDQTAEADKATEASHTATQVEAGESADLPEPETKE